MSEALGMLPKELLIEILVTSLAAMMFVSLGTAIRTISPYLRRRKTKKDRPSTRFIAKTRPFRVKQFQRIASEVLKDVSEALIENPSRPHDARAFLPLVSDIRKRGQSLLAKRSIFHVVAFPLREEKLGPLVRELIQAEELLKSLPRPQLSFDDLALESID